MTFKPLNEQVIVITGASSGIGLATARAAGRAGAKLVLASRNENVLKEVVRELEAAGTEAAYVVADVGNREQVQKIADTAIERFGRFDTWINDAGLGMLGRLEEVSEEDSQRLFQTNFWGVVNGSLVALPELKKHGGKLINLGSVASDHAFPLQGMYCASKHAIKGFTDCLRIELAEEGAPVSVTLIKPGAINTPFPQHARNYMDKEPKLPPPVYAPEEVAKAILYAATHEKRDIYIGSGGRAMSIGNRLVPQIMDRLGKKSFAAQKRDESPRNPAGALYQAGDDGNVAGDHPGHVMQTSFYTRATLRPVVTGLALAAVGVTAYTLINRRNRRLQSLPDIGEPDLTEPRVEDQSF